MEILPIKEEFKKLIKSHEDILNDLNILGDELLKLKLWSSEMKVEELKNKVYFNIKELIPMIEKFCLGLSFTIES